MWRSFFGNFECTSCINFQSVPPTSVTLSPLKCTFGCRNVQGDRTAEPFNCCTTFCDDYEVQRRVQETFIQIANNLLYWGFRALEWLHIPQFQTQWHTIIVIIIIHFSIKQNPLKTGNDGITNAFDIHW